MVIARVPFADAQCALMDCRDGTSQLLLMANAVYAWAAATATSEASVCLRIAWLVSLPNSLVPCELCHVDSGGLVCQEVNGDVRCPFGSHRGDDFQCELHTASDD